MLDIAERLCVERRMIKTQRRGVLAGSKIVPALRIVRGAIRGLAKSLNPFQRMIDEDERHARRVL